jgi:hypothetical protein
MRVHHEQSNAITLFHLGRYGIDHLIGSIIQFFECESTTGRHIEQRFVVGVKEGTFSKDRTDV